LNDTDKGLFLEHGYLHACGVLDTEHLARLREEFDRVWGVEEPPVSQCKLLRHRAFLELIEHPPVLRRHRYYGYWWLRRFDVEGEKHQLPWQALEGASEERLLLLGQQLPGATLHMYDPAA
jgi:hypothetical protein